MLSSGVSKRKIARALHISRNTVDKYATGNPEHLAQRTSKAFAGLHSFQSEIISLLDQGYYKKEICQYLSSLGYTGKLTQFYDYCHFLTDEGLISTPILLNRNELIDSGAKQKYHYVTRQQIFRSIWSDQDTIPDSDWKILHEHYPIINVVVECIRDFRSLFDSKDQTDLEVFIAKYKDSSYKVISRFSLSLQKDFAPVCQAVISSYSNGFVEGVNNKLKMIKRVGYGRSSLNLLKAKMILSSFFDP